MSQPQRMCKSAMTRKYHFVVFCQEKGQRLTLLVVLILIYRGSLTFLQRDDHEDHVTLRAFCSSNVTPTLEMDIQRDK